MLKNQNYRIAIYVRVSTEEQAENPEGSIKSQEQRLREAVNWRNRNSNFGEIAGIYIDAGISAKDMKRPRLQDMLRDIREGKVNLVMVTELSRLSRNNRDFLSMWDLMSEHKCSFMSLREDFDTTTAAGEMLLFQLMNFAQFERKQTSERVAANVVARAGRGLYNGGCIPLGYKRNPARPGYLEVDEEHAQTVRVAFDTFLQEGSLSATARWMNSKGYRARVHMEGGGNRARIGHFTVDNLHVLLKNKAYVGIKVFTQKGEKKEAKAVWEGIVDPLVFQRVDELLKKNHSRLKPQRGQSRHPYLLSGITFCMTCGDYMPGKSATGRNGKVAYYEHSWATKRESCLTKKTFHCAPTRVQAKILEPLVWGEFCQFLESKEFVLSLMEKVRELHAENDVMKERGRLKAKLYGVKSQLQGLAERLAILPLNLSPEPIFKQMEKLEEMKKEIEEKLLNLEDYQIEQKMVGIESFEEFAAHSRRVLQENPDFNLKRRILQKFIRRIEVGVDSIKIFWNLDKEHYTREIAFTRSQPSSASAEEGPLIFSGRVGSHTLTNGHPTRT